MTDIERELRALGERTRGQEPLRPALGASTLRRIKLRRVITGMIAAAATVSVILGTTYVVADLGKDGTIPPAEQGRSEGTGRFHPEREMNVLVLGSRGMNEPFLQLSWGGIYGDGPTEMACAGALPPSTSRVEVASDRTSGPLISWHENFVRSDDLEAVCMHEIDATTLSEIANHPETYSLVVTADDIYTVQLTTAFVAGSCGPPVDFKPTYLPEGWIESLQPGSAGGAEWDGLVGHYGNDAPAGTVDKADGGMAELIAGESPYALAGGEKIRVLDGPALLGEIHEGYSVEFTQDDCDYSLLGYGITRDELRRFAEGLRLPG